MGPSVAGGDGFGFEDNGAEAEKSQVMGGGKSGRPGSDDGNALAIGLANAGVHAGMQEGCHFFSLGGAGGGVSLNGGENFSGGAGFRSGHVAGEAFQGSDRDGTVSGDETAIVIDAGDFTSTAGGFTGGAADSATDGGEGVGSPGNQIGFFKAAGSYSPNVAAGVRVDGAGYLAGY